MAAGVTTSIRMPAEVRDLYETISRATGQTRNDLMVEALRLVGEQKVRDIAMILEGRDQARAGRLTPIADVVARFKAQGMLPADYSLADEEDHPRV